MNILVGNITAYAPRRTSAAVLLAGLLSAFSAGSAQAVPRNADASSSSSAAGSSDCCNGGLLVVGSHTVELKSSGFVLTYHQSLESTDGDPKTVDAALASMQSTLNTLTGEAGIAAVAARIERVRIGSAQEGGYSSKSRSSGKIGEATWVVRVPDRSALEAMLVRTAPLGKQLTLQSIKQEFSKLDPAARQAALAGAGADALKTAEAMVSQANGKIGRLLVAREISSFDSMTTSIDASEVFVSGKRVWMPEMANPTMTVRLECRFEIQAK